MAKVKVNHTGGFGTYSYEAHKVFEVQAADLAELKKALGEDVTVLEEDKKAHEPEKEAAKEPVKEEKKEAKPDHNKMVGKGETITK